MAEEPSEPQPKPTCLSRTKGILLWIWKKFLEQWFIFGMGFVILLAYFIPFVGKKGGWIHPEITVTYVSVIVIFFLTGLAIKVAALKNALLSWKHQLLTLTITFLITPSLTYGVSELLGHFDAMNEFLLEGLTIMGTLPTTISSCNVLTQVAQGNEAVAVVNSVLGNALGVFISPALILLFLKKNSSLDIGNIFLQLGVSVVIPMIVGIVLQFIIPKPIAWLKSKVNFSYINQSILLLVIFSVFCDTFSQSFSLSATDIIIILVLVSVLHFIYLAISYVLFLPKFMRFTWEDRVAGLFCASQKTLTLGIPLISILYANSSDPNAGLATIPTLVIHPLQLVVAGLLASKIPAWKPKYQPLRGQSVGEMGYDIEIDEDAHEQPETLNLEEKPPESQAH